MVEQQPARPAAQAGITDEDKRLGYRVIKYASTPQEQELNDTRSSNSWAHSRPNSVLIAALGHHWKEGSWQAVMDMLHYTNQHGYYASFEEVMDRCFNPYDSLGAMRNECIMRAMEGYEYLLMVDNDVLPHPEDLVRLIDHGVPVVAPMILEPGTGKPLHGPEQKRWDGLRPVRWTVLSMLLFKTTVFNATGPELWNDSIGADEGYHFQKLWHYGHRPYLDTDIQLQVQSTPTYPLATNRMEQKDADAFWDSRRKGLLEIPDRLPVDPNDKRISELGEYLPFMNPSGTAVEAPASQDVVQTQNELDLSGMSRAHELVTV
jgi:hypothetical protein